MVKVENRYYTFPRFGINKKQLDAYPGYESCFEYKTGPKLKILAMGSSWEKWGDNWTLTSEKEGNFKTNMVYFEVPEK